MKTMEWMKCSNVWNVKWNENESEMKARWGVIWGSCEPSYSIRLNPSLILSLLTLVSLSLSLSLIAKFRNLRKSYDIIDDHSDSNSPSFCVCVCVCFFLSGSVLDSTTKEDSFGSVFWSATSNLVSNLGNKTCESVVSTTHCLSSLMAQCLNVLSPTYPLMLLFL